MNFCMIILFLSSKTLSIAMLRHAYMVTRYVNDCIILNKFNEYYFEQATVIIPCGIFAQFILASKYNKYKDKFLLSPSVTRNTLDDKINCYKSIIKNNFLDGTKIKLINSYNDYDGPNVSGKYMLKKRNTAGSVGNINKEGNIYDLIKKYGKTHQIQDIMKVKNIHSVNCICKDGEVVSKLNFVIASSVNPNFYKNNRSKILLTPDPDVTLVVERIIEKFNFTGLCEIEFLEDTNENLYIMEINPRITGNSMCVSVNNENNAPYIRNIINPYISIVTNEQIRICKYPDNYKLMCMYVIELPKYHIDADGLFHFETAQN
jgi:predicted ATP-grasp superfamily ATP-dependent carboligase